MALALFITLLSVAVGTLLAFVPGRSDRWLGPARTFALTAALGVVVLHLLPSSLHELGAWTVVAFLAGLVAPGILEKTGQLLWKAGAGSERSHMALEASYAGLLLHRVGDGVGLGAFAGELALSRGSGGVIAALAAHAVPVVAIVVLTFDSVQGRGVAVRRAIGLAVAGVLGVLLAQSVVAETLAHATAWLSPLVGGMLLHVVFHDLSIQAPTDRPGRVADLLAGFGGLGVALLGLEAHGNAHEEAHRIEALLLDWALQVGPLLLLAALLSALIAASLGPRLAKTTPRRGSPSRQILGGLAHAVAGPAVFGTAVHPGVAAHPNPAGASVLTGASWLRACGAPAGRQVLILLGAPVLGVETLTFTVALLGAPLAAFRWVGSFALAAFGAAVIALTRKSVAAAPQAEAACGDSLVALPASWRERFVAAFDAALFRHGAWLGLGVVAAALVQLGLSPGELKGLLWPQMILVSVLASVGYFRAPAATPLAAVLLGSGTPAPLVLAGLLLGPSVHVVIFSRLKQWFGGCAAWWVALTSLSCALACVMLLHYAPFELELPATSLGQQWELLLSLVAAAALLRGIWRRGVRGFVSSLQLPGSHRH